MLEKEAVKNEQSSVDQVKKNKHQKQQEAKYKIEEAEEMPFVKEIVASPTM